jgi:hypothetical protein
MMSEPGGEARRGGREAVWRKEAFEAKTGTHLVELVDIGKPQCA